MKKIMKSDSTAGQWVKKTLCTVVLIGMGLAMGATTVLAKGSPNHGFKQFTPVSRIAQMNVVRVKGQIDYTASYAKARAASVHLELMWQD